MADIMTDDEGTLKGTPTVKMRAKGLHVPRACDFVAKLFP